MNEITDPLELNETLRSIARRRSIRQFTSEPVTREEVNLLLEAANRAPSAHNQQSWRFIIVGPETRRQLVELVNQRAGAFPRPAAVLLRMASRTMASAPVVIAVANTGDLMRHGEELFAIDGEGTVDFFRTMEIQSSAAAVENLLLAATSLDLAAVWLGILYLLKDEVRRLLGEPEGEFMAVIPVGRPAVRNKGPKKRSLESTARYLP